MIYKICLNQEKKYQSVFFLKKALKLSLKVFENS